MTKGYAQQGRLVMSLSRNVMSCRSDVTSEG